MCCQCNFPPVNVLLYKTNNIRQRGECQARGEQGEKAGEIKMTVEVKNLKGSTG